MGKSDRLECEQRSNPIWSTDRQKRRYHACLPAVAALDQPQLTLPLPEAEHTDRPAFQRQGLQVIQVFFHRTESKIRRLRPFSSLPPQQHSLQTVTSA